jgi:para-aminobenzoate synthetase/4-amino-4-deoxychorismate lyase
VRYVLLDDQVTGKQFVFHAPDNVITAAQREDLPAAFAKIQKAQRDGKWLAGFLSYELGYGLEPHFEAPTGGLINLGVFDAPSYHPPANWLYTRNIPALDFQPDWSEADYLSRFNQVQAYLRAGDCYQVNLTFPMRAESSASAAQIYAAFRRRQPGRYGSVVSLGGADVVSFSPELFFQRKGQNMRMRPMKGTRPRAVDPEDDKRLLSEMRAEPKSQAENLMIVDLLRNDLSRLCVPGSVEVPELFSLETYPTLHQMTSEVTGILRDDATWPDILKSLFPCGSVTGAPKIRAMEIIQALEASPRGAYCGSVGYIAPNGDASFSVAIRTIQMQDGRLRYDVGSGVVLDSEGPDEYRECLLKSQIFSPPPDGVIETFRRSPNGEIPRGALHEARLKTQIGPKAASAIEQVKKIQPGLDAHIRIVSRGEEIDHHIIPFVDLETPLLLALSRYALTPELQETQFKTTVRDFYDGERARLKALTGVDEVIFLNEEGELCEGSFTSLFIQQETDLLTPDASCGLLPGVLRQDLLNRGQAVETRLTLRDIKRANQIFVGNSLRGLMPAKFIDYLPH